MGAIAPGGVVALTDYVIQYLGVPEHLVERVIAREARELARRERAYRGDRPPPAVQGKTVILIDDGLATGSSMRAAVEALHQGRPARVVVAVPIASRETCEALHPHVDEVICAVTPEPFHAVGLWYDDFSEVTDDEVRELLARAARRERGDAATREAHKGGWA
jgi:predicted phosphoribosyltransferase